MPCPFCQRLTDGPLVAESALAAAFLDAYPLNEGHCLIVPRRHESDFFALTSEEQSAVWTLANDVRQSREMTRIPDGYNVGINIGAAAGQTVAHAHLHIVPRFCGDVEDPRGGIRWIIPARAAYWKDR